MKIGTTEHARGMLQAAREIAHVAWIGRLDARVYHWARKISDPFSTVREKVQAIVDAFRASSKRVPSPIDETFPSAAQALFEQRSFDSDDVTIALGAACMSIGIPVKVIAASYKDQMFTHVYFAARDEKGEWLKVDGTGELPVGEVLPAQQEMETVCEEDAR